MANRNAHTIAAFDCNRVDSGQYIPILDKFCPAQAIMNMCLARETIRESRFGTYTDRGSVRVHKHCGEV